MQKIISLFQRNYQGDRLVRDEVVPGAEWVIKGEGIATRKYDGTCCAILADGLFVKRYDAKQGKNPPNGFIPAQDPDPITGHWPGWIPVGKGPEDRWHMEGYNNTKLAMDHLDPGTYELVGPKVQGNPEGLKEHHLIKHDAMQCYPECPRDFEGIRRFLSDLDIEGIVWHHPDGRMVKIKKKDFWLERKPTVTA